MYNGLLAQHNQLSSSYIVLQEEKSKVADALIQAENTAKDIISSAHRQAEFERRELEEKSESLRVNIVDKNKQLRDMRLEVTQMCNGVKAQMEAALKAITDKMDEEINSFNATVSSVENKYDKGDQQ
jgi:F0F1-type ATP synthase membrane subunit b/b'